MAHIWKFHSRMNSIITFINPVSAELAGGLTSECSQGKVLQKAARTCEVYLGHYACLKILCQKVFLLLPMASRLIQGRTSKRKAFGGFT